MVTLPPSLTNTAQYTAIAAVVAGLLVLYFAGKTLTTVLLSAVITLVLVVLIICGAIYFASSHTDEVATFATNIIGVPPEVQLLKQVDIAKLVPVLLVLQQVDPEKLKVLM